MSGFDARTFTFVFTDIEGSTRMWEEHPDAMDAALQKHDELMRSVFESNLGHIFKTVGDMFCVAFVDPADAVRACVAGQLALADASFDPLEPLRVRMGIYTGTARFRDNDYFGPGLNRVSRLMSAGHGGQILLARDSANMVSGSMPDDTSLREMGVFRLRDVDQPEEIFQLLHPQLRAEFEPLRTIDALPNNLPRELTTFIGREEELREIQRLTREKSLVTLIGSGGCGKTRLAVQIAHDIGHKFKNGVWFIDLAPLADASLLAPTILTTMNLREEAGMKPLDSLKHHLRSQHTLIVLDNCEHLVEASAQVVAQVLQVAPNVKILATSREALGVSGEATWRVPSLGMPEVDATSAAEVLENSEAVRLFVERATAAKADFGLTDENASAIVQICRRLDGIPLAIELAAARVKVLPVDQLSSRLDDRFRLLTGGSRTALPRQQTLRALIDWSYNLLTEEEKLLLCRLAVFTGGWTLDRAEEICGGEPLEAWQVLDLLTQLVDKSLVQFDVRRGASRYTMLETVRQYSREKLFDSFEAPALRTKHLESYTTFIENELPRLGGADQAQALNEIELDHDNVRAALEWASADDSLASTFLRLARGMGRFWELRGFFREGRLWLERAIEATKNSDDDVRMRALNQLGNICRDDGEFDAARDAYLKSLELAEQLGFDQGTAVLHNNLGITSVNQMRIAEAIGHYEQSIALCREKDYVANLGAALDNMGMALTYEGQLDRARELHQEATAVFERLQDERSLAVSAYMQAELELRAGNWELAHDKIVSCLAGLIDLDYKMGIMSAVDVGARIAIARGLPEDAARLLGFAGRYRSRHGLSLPPVSVAMRTEAESQVAALLDPERLETLDREGGQMSPNSALEVVRGSSTENGSLPGQPRTE